MIFVSTNPLLWAIDYLITHLDTIPTCLCFPPSSHLDISVLIKKTPTRFVINYWLERRLFNWEVVFWIRKYNSSVAISLSTSPSLWVLFQNTHTHTFPFYLLNWKKKNRKCSNFSSLLKQRFDIQTDKRRPSIWPLVQFWGTGRVLWPHFQRAPHCEPLSTKELFPFQFTTVRFTLLFSCSFLSSDDVYF